MSAKLCIEGYCSIMISLLICSQGIYGIFVVTFLTVKLAFVTTSCRNCLYDENLPRQWKPYTIISTCYTNFFSLMTANC